MPPSRHPPHPSRRRAGRHPLEQRVSIAAVRIDSRGAHCAVVQHLAMQRRQGDVHVLVTRVSAARTSGDVLHQVVDRARPPGRDGDEEQHRQQQEWTHKGSRPARLRARGSMRGEGRLGDGVPVHARVRARARVTGAGTSAARRAARACGSTELGVTCRAAAPMGCQPESVRWISPLVVCQPRSVTRAVGTQLGPPKPAAHSAHCGPAYCAGQRHSPEARSHVPRPQSRAHAFAGVHFGG